MPPSLWTELAHAAVMLEIPFDPHDLYFTADQDYLVWLNTLCEKVLESRRRQADSR